MRAHYLARHLLHRNEVWFAHRRGARAPGDRLPLAGRVTNHPNRFLQLFNPLFLLRLWFLVRRRKVDHIIATHFWSGIHAALLRWLTGRPLLIDTHNVEHIRFRRMGHWTWPLVWLGELLVYHSAQEIFAVSETDRQLLQRRLRVPAARIRVVPNGADVATMMARQVNEAAVRTRLGLEPDDRFVLFFGSLQHPPNARAARIIVEELLPRLRQAGVSSPIVLTGPGRERFLATLDDPPPAQIHFAGFVEDIVPVIKSAHAVIVPLVSGSGTRFKIIEAVACGRPAISTTIGAEGLERAAFGSFLIVRDSWEGFAGAVAAVLEEGWNRPVPTSFIARYDWEAVFAGV